MSKFFINGPEPPYEPCKGGLGVEMYEAMKRNKDKEGQITIENGETQTYSELLSKSIKIAKFLQELKLGKDDFVSMCSSNNSNSSIPLIASLFVDVKYVSLDPAMIDDDMIHAFQYLQPKIIFVQADAHDKVNRCIEASGHKIKTVVFEGAQQGSFNDILNKFSDDNFTPVFIEDIKKTALVFFSSGTTGKPKAICLNHYSLLAQTVNFISWVTARGTVQLTNYIHSFPDQNLNILVFGPMYWISSILVLLVTTFTGSCRISGSKFTSEQAWKAFVKHKIITTFLPPGQINELCSDEKNYVENTSLEVVVTGGGPVKESHLKNMKRCFPKSTITQILGSTENSGIISSFDIKNPNDMKYLDSHLSSCGRIFYGSSAKIVDPETEQLLGPNEQGELRLKTKYFMNGFYNMDSSTAYDSDGWLKTGDLAKFDENGYLYILDRIKDILLYTIYNINPSVIEEILVQHPAVLESFVIGIPHPKDNEHPMGVVLLKDEYKGKQSDEEIVRFVNDRVPADKYKIRAGVKFIDEIFKTVTGKIKKNHMKDLILQGKI